MSDKIEMTPVGKAEENTRRLQYIKQRAHDDFIKKAEECTDFFFSKQWDPKDTAKLELSGRPHLTMNRIKPVMINMLGEYLQQRMSVKCIPDANGTPESARAIDKLFIDTMNRIDYKSRELELVMEGLLTSRAYFDIRMDFDDNFKGNVAVSVPNPKNVLPDPDADSYDPDSWNDVIVVSRQSIMDIETNYGEAVVDNVKAHGTTISNDDNLISKTKNTFGEGHDGEDIPDEGPGGIDNSTRSLYLVIERQFRVIEPVDFFVNNESGDSVRVPVDWDEEDVAEYMAENENVSIEKRRAPVIRWRVSCGSVLLHDKLSPYDFFTIVPYFPVFYRGQTAAPVEDLIDPQRNYNKLRSQELHIVNGTSNSGWKVRKGALTNMRTNQLETEGSKVGLVLEFSGSPDDIQRIDPVQIPQGLDRISSKAEADIGAISGIQDEARGVARADVAGKAIAARRQAVLTSMAMYLENLAITRRILAKRMLNLFQRYYDEERTLMVTSGGLNDRHEQIDINYVDEEGTVKNDITQGNYDITITTTAMRESFDNTQFSELVELQKLGVPIPSHLFVEHSTLDRKEELAQELRAAAGTDTPSEEERQLANMERQVALAERQASAEARLAQAELSRARAQKVLEEIREGSLTPEKEAQLMLKARELAQKERDSERSYDIRDRHLQLEKLRTLLADLSAEDAQRATDSGPSQGRDQTTRTEGE